MFPDSPFAPSVGSFRVPVAPVLEDPASGPQVVVSFNRAYLPYVVGSLFQLLLQATWATNDPATLNLQQEQVFSLIDLFNGIPPAPTAGIEEDLAVPIRVDCNCRVFITCCDGTEKELVTLDMINHPTQPGPSPQPPAGGGQQCYHAVLNANSTWFLPTVLNTGDIVQINNGAGAVSNSHTANWHCISGDQFFAGACVGFPETNGSNPVPTAPTSSLVIEVGGVFYSLASGSWTVPSGVVNLPATIQVNDNSIAALSGQFVFDACVTNNVPATWSHDFDLTVSPHNFEPFTDSGYGTTGTWISGTGFRASSTADPIIPANQQTSLLVKFNAAFSANISDVQITFFTDQVGGAGSPTRAVCLASGVCATIPDASGGQFFDAGGHNPSTELVVIINTSNNSPASTGNNYLSRLQVSGSGPDPFATS